MRRSKLITPVLRRDLLEKAAASDADIVHIELEDGVPAAQKSVARRSAVAALFEVDWHGKEVWVRVNAPDSPEMERDIAIVVAAKPAAVIVPKVSGPEDVALVAELIRMAEVSSGVSPGTVKIAAVIEVIRGLDTVEEIAAADPRMTALVLGTDDMSVEYGYRLDRDGPSWETLYLKSRSILAARLAGIDCLDAAHFHYRDADGTKRSAEWSRQLGFTGKTCLSPRQVSIVNAAFSPSEAEITWAHAVIDALDAAEAEGKSVAVADGMMVDRPHALQAREILERAAAAQQTL
jgi:citrate lyase subunit beta / citryl-CoA lyase